MAHPQGGQYRIAAQELWREQIDPVDSDQINLKVFQHERHQKDVEPTENASSPASFYNVLIEKTHRRRNFCTCSLVRINGFDPMNVKNRTHATHGIDNYFPAC